jgi:ABC-type nitrate/sulfonate/bicarbonate transport system permease component
LRGGSAWLFGIFQRVWLILLGALAWELISRARESFFVPPLSAIIRRFSEMWLSPDPTRLFVSHTFVQDAIPSFSRFFMGWGLAVFIGITLGVLLGRSEILSAAIDPLVRFGMAIPPPALLPFAIVLLGIGDSMKVFLIAFGTVWPVLLNTIDGVRTIDPTALNTARILRLSRRRYITNILLPGAAPQIMAGIRVSLATGIILMVIAELFASTRGIGFRIINAQRLFRPLEMWAGIMLLALFGLVLNLLFVRVERRLLHWHLRARETDV